MLIIFNKTEEAANDTIIRPHLRLIDLGSAVDAESFKRMYGAEGPSGREQTHEYAPPEMLLAR